MEAEHEGQSDKNGGPNRGDKEEERGIIKKKVHETRRGNGKNKRFFFCKKKHENSTNQIAVFMSRDHQANKKRKFRLSGELQNYGVLIGQF